MTTRTSIAVMSAVLVLLAVSAASASIAMYQSNKDLALKSEEVLVGEVKARTSFVDEKTNTPYTLTTVTVKEWLKGGAGEKEITVRQMGGKLGDKVMSVTGDAKLDDGEEVEDLLQATESALLAAKRTGKNRCCALGLDTGS